MSNIQEFVVAIWIFLYIVVWVWCILNYNEYVKRVRDLDIIGKIKGLLIISWIVINVVGFIGLNILVWR